MARFAHHEPVAEPRLEFALDAAREFLVARHGHLDRDRSAHHQQRQDGDSGKGPAADGRGHGWGVSNRHRAGKAVCPL
jgi:hypothetical protein